MRPGTRILLLLLLGMGGSVALVVWEGCRRAGQAIDRHEKDVEQRIAALYAQDPRRPALGGPTEPGNAWPLHVRALAALQAIPDLEVKEIPRLSEEQGFVPDPAKLTAVFVKAAPEVDLLRQALRREECRPDYEYEKGMAMDKPFAGQVIRAARIMAGWMDLLHAEGKDREAMELLRVTLGTAHDSSRHGLLINQLVMLAAEGEAGDSAKDILAAHALGAKDLEALAADLDLLSKSRPAMSDAFAREGLLARRTLVSIARGGEGIGAVPAGLLGLGRFSTSGALNLFEKHFKELEAVGSLPCDQRAAAAGKVSQEAMKSNNDLVRLLMPATAKAYQREAEAEMRRTLLKVAVALAWYEAEKGAFPARLEELVPRHLPKLPLCPLTGQPLLHSAGKVWSPDWGGNVESGQVPGDGQDSDRVWTVRRKK